MKRSVNNKLQTLPAGIGGLKSLTELNVSRMKSLESLHPAVAELTNLKEIDCYNSYNLKSPPYAVCKQGASAIKKYYRDLAEKAGVRRPIISAAVIGNRMAGKTSLIRTLKNQKRELTYRDESDVDDETTKVFEVNEVSLGDTTLRMFDFGGDKVYHLSYQLTIRPSYIPIVVVNMEQFDKLASTASVEEATRQLCMDFLSHLYLPCVSLGPPFLVLTHADRLSSEVNSSRKIELLDAVERIRARMIQEEKNSFSKRKLVRKIIHFTANDKPIFYPELIFVFSNSTSDVSNIRSLLQALSVRCNESITVIPFIWEQIAAFIENQADVPFLLVEDIVKRFPSDKDMVVVRFMHNEGRLLWFERENNLRGIVFHRVSAITDVISILFDHRNVDLWKQRIQDFDGFTFQGKAITEAKYKSMVNSFEATGTIDECLLMHLFSQQTFPKDVAISLLQTFYLICGPIESKPRAKYIIPYLSADTIQPSPPASGLLRVQTAVVFVGVPPPSYVYHVLVVAFLNLFTDPRYQIRAASNGASVSHGKLITTLHHNYRTREITLYTDTPVEQLDHAWKCVFDILEAILKKLKSVWIAAHPVCKFFCSHCIYSGEIEADCEVDPDWYTPPENPDTDPPLTDRLMNFSGVEPVACCNDRSNGGPLTVPSPLRFPCE